MFILERQQLSVNETIRFTREILARLEREGLLDYEKAAMELREKKRLEAKVKKANA